jgi:hypothetical protein
MEFLYKYNENGKTGIHMLVALDMYIFACFYIRSVIHIFLLRSKIKRRRKKEERKKEKRSKGRK